MDDLFIKGPNEEPWEGKLSEQEPELLIVLKEPHGEELDCFWMKKVIEAEEKGTRYFNVLGAFAKFILKDSLKDSSSENLTHKSALEKCAYINLFPFWGKSTAKEDEETNKSYVELMKWWKELPKDKKGEAGEISEESELEEILSNRLAIIKCALDSGISVAAHKEIVARMVEDEMFRPMLEKKPEPYTQNPYPLDCYAYDGNRAKLYAIPHPAGRLKYADLKTALYGSEIVSKDLQQKAE